MRALKNRLVPFVIAASFGFAIAGCQSTQHRMAEPQSGTKIACRKCYDEMKQASLGMSGKQSPGYYTRHACEGCRTEMSVYSEDGVLKMKCAKCVPQGVACDKCLPPDSSAK